MKKIIIISAVNFFEGGPLTILKDNLAFANSNLSDEYEIIALVHDKKLLPVDELSAIKFMEFPKSRKSYFNRLYLEYYYFKKLSKKIKPYLWFSLHDITPNVAADRQVVYCHNPTPFNKIMVKDLFFQPVIFFFSLFYKLLYQININRNRYVIVQQLWLKDKFVELFGLNPDKIIVNYPETIIPATFRLSDKSENVDAEVVFFYPALARPFKNFEVIGKAVKILAERGVRGFKVVFTISGQENNYAKYIHKHYSSLSEIEFVGKLPLDIVHEYYNSSTALLFTSALETWGLPITEFKSYNKPIILSDLPYAHETLGNYEKAYFFESANAVDLADKMVNVITKSGLFDSTPPVNGTVLAGWDSLYNKILEN